MSDAATVETPTPEAAWMGEAPSERPAKVETKTPDKSATAETSPVEAGTEQPASSSEPDKPRDEEGKFVKLDSKARRDYEKRIAILTARNKELEAGRVPKSTAAATVAETASDTPVSTFNAPKPVLADYMAKWQADQTLYDGDPYQAHTVAMAKWELKKDAFDEQHQSQVITASRQAVEKAYLERATAFAADHPDFDEVVTKSPIAKVNCGPVLNQLAWEDDNGPEVVYYLSQHPSEALGLVATYRHLPPTEENLDLVRQDLALRLATGSRGSVAETPRTVNAPPPAGRLGAGTRTTTERAIDLAAKGGEDFDASGYGARRREERKAAR